MATKTSVVSCLSLLCHWLLITSSYGTVVLCSVSGVLQCYFVILINSLLTCLFLVPSTVFFNIYCVCHASCLGVSLHSLGMCCLFSIASIEEGVSQHYTGASASYYCSTASVEYSQMVLRFRRSEGDTVRGWNLHGQVAFPRAISLQAAR